MSTFVFETAEVVREAARYWWLYLLTGIAWIVVSLLIFRFDMTSLATISYLFGVIAIFFGVNEFLMLIGSSWGWKIVHILLGALFVIGGVIALFNPTQTFLALAGIVGLVLIIKGTFDIVVSIATRSEISIWWLQLVVGIFELLLGVWASGPGFEEWGRRVVLLVLWVGFTCLFRGITEIVFAFKLRGVKSDIEKLQPA